MGCGTDEARVWKLMRIRKSKRNQNGHCKTVKSFKYFKLIKLTIFSLQQRILIQYNHHENDRLRLK